jgi:outer membrane protein assembly factor BamB
MRSAEVVAAQRDHGRPERPRSRSATDSVRRGPVGARPSLGLPAVLGLMGVASILVILPLLGPPWLSGVPTPASYSTAFESVAPSPALVAGANFPTYLDNPQRTSNVSGELLINARDVANLTHLWSVNVGKTAFPQPIAVNGVVYAGSGTGYEYAIAATNGTELWKTFVGVDAAHGDAGVTSTATWSDGTIYVGGGNSTLYALNASSGKILWETLVGQKGRNYYVWSSPLVHGAYVYLGVDSYLDNPLVGSGLDQFYRSNGSLDHYFNSSVPDVNGSGVWSSPALSGNRVYFDTGNAEHAAPSTYSESIVSVNRTSLAFIDSYQVNKTQRIGDGDFGASPTIYSEPTHRGTIPMVAAVNKNSILYAWYLSNLTLAWDVRVSNPGSPNDTIASAAWNGEYLYDLSRGTSINGVAYNESIRAFNGRTGQIVWQLGLPQPLSQAQYAAPLCFNGMVVVPDNKLVYFLNATNGHLLFRYDAGATVTVAPSVSRGEIFLSLLSGEVVALDLKETSVASASVRSGSVLTPDSFQVTARGGLPPYFFWWNFGDGSYSALPDPAHSYDSPGIYHVSVTVTDQAGTVSEAKLTVVVDLGIASIPGASSAGLAGTFVLARFLT